MLKISSENLMIKLKRYTNVKAYSATKYLPWNCPGSQSNSANSIRLSRIIQWLHDMLTLTPCKASFQKEKIPNPQWLCHTPFAPALQFWVPLLCRVQQFDGHIPLVLRPSQLFLRRKYPWGFSFWFSSEAMQWFGEREVFSAPFKVTPSSRQIFLGCLRDPGMGLSLRHP